MSEISRLNLDTLKILLESWAGLHGANKDGAKPSTVQEVKQFASLLQSIK